MGSFDIPSLETAITRSLIFKSGLKMLQGPVMAQFKELEKIKKHVGDAWKTDPVWTSTAAKGFDLLSAALNFERYTDDNLNLKDPALHR